MPGHEAVSTLHRPKNDILAFFKFLQKKVSRLDKKAPALFCTVLGVVICKNHVAKPLDSSQMVDVYLSHLPMKQIL